MMYKVYLSDPNNNRPDPEGRVPSTGVYGDSGENGIPLQITVQHVLGDECSALGDGSEFGYFEWWSDREQQQQQGQQQQLAEDAAANAGQAANNIREQHALDPPGSQASEGGSDDDFQTDSSEEEVEEEIEVECATPAEQIANLTRNLRSTASYASEDIEAIIRVLQEDCEGEEEEEEEEEDGEVAEEEGGEVAEVEDGAVAEETVTVEAAGEDAIEIIVEGTEQSENAREDEVIGSLQLSNGETGGNNASLSRAVTELRQNSSQLLSSIPDRANNLELDQTTYDNEPFDDSSLLRDMRQNPTLWMQQQQVTRQSRAKFVSATIIKPSRRTNLGLELMTTDSDVIEIVNVATDGFLYVSGAPFQEGDQLLSIRTRQGNHFCGTSIGGIGKHEIMRLLRRATGPITIIAQNPTGNPEWVESMTSKPHPEFGTGIFFVSGSPQWQALQIHSVPSNGLFANSLLHRDDQVLSINGLDCSSLDACVATDIVKSAPRFVTIVTQTTAAHLMDALTNSNNNHNLNNFSANHNQNNHTDSVVSADGNAVAEGATTRNTPHRRRRSSCGFFRR